MNLNKEELSELNTLLKNTNIEIPDFRREVSPNGNNYKWLQKHITARNPNINPRVKELLHV